MSESPVQWQGWIKPTELHIAHLKAKFQDWLTYPRDITPWFRTPLLGGFWTRGLAFRTPFPLTENDIVHCVLILQGVMSCSSDLATDGVLTQGGMSGGLCPPVAPQKVAVYTRGVCVCVCVCQNSSEWSDHWGGRSKSGWRDTGVCSFCAAKHIRPRSVSNDETQELWYFNN